MIDWNNKLIEISILFGISTDIYLLKWGYYTFQMAVSSYIYAASLISACSIPL
jgi:hypothetical protein